MSDYYADWNGAIRHRPSTPGAPVLTNLDHLERMAFDRPGLQVENYDGHAFLTVAGVTWYAPLGGA